jgi:hypothetical protein
MPASTPSKPGEHQVQRACALGASRNFQAKNLFDDTDRHLHITTLAAKTPSSSINVSTGSVLGRKEAYPRVCGDLIPALFPHTRLGKFYNTLIELIVPCYQKLLKNWLFHYC